MDIINIIIRTSALLYNPQILFNPRINKTEFILTPYLESEVRISDEINTLKNVLNIKILQNENVEDSKKKIKNLKDSIQSKTANLTVSQLYNILNGYYFKYYNKYYKNLCLNL